MDNALAEGVALVNDMSESQLLTLIKEKNYPAISFWLKRHRNDNYKNKIEITTKEDNEELTPSQAKIVKQALKLANITKSNRLKTLILKNTMTKIIPNALVNTMLKDRSVRTSITKIVFCISSTSTMPTM
jgi:hypothetical protein